MMLTATVKESGVVKWAIRLLRHHLPPTLAAAAVQRGDLQ